jgi:HSP20 family protein
MAIDTGNTRNTATLDRLFNAAFAPYLAGGTVSAANGASTGIETLPLNVWETTEGYGADLLAPGLDEHSVNVTLDDDTLSIEGELRCQAPEGANVIQMEFAPAKFRRSLRLGAVIDSAKVEASYHNGWLTLRMPKVEHARPRQIQVRVSQGDVVRSASEKVGDSV